MRLAAMTFAFSAIVAVTTSQAAATADASAPIAKDAQASVLLFADEFNAGQLDRSRIAEFVAGHWPSAKQLAAKVREIRDKAQRAVSA